MPLIKTFGAVAAATLLVAVPNASAQHRSGGHSRGGGGRASTMGVATPRSFGGPRSFGAPRSMAAPRPFAPRTYGSRVGSLAPRSYSYGASRVYVAQHRGGAVVGHAVPRVGPRYIAGARYGYPARFYRPYYAFRPRLSIGLGLWAGFPIAYPYYYGYYNPFYAYGYPYSYTYPAYGYPYPYAPYGAVYPETYPAYPPPAGYPAPAYPQATYPQSSYPPPSGSTSVQPENTGGVSFEITPATAEVYVDGSYVGTVGQFTPTTQPLGLPAGRHRVEIRSPGYQTMAFDVDIVVGQVIPYRGALRQ